MKRVFVVGGAWGLVLAVGAIGLAADVKRQGNQPATPQAQPAAPNTTHTERSRFVPPTAGSTNSSSASRAADGLRAAQAAQAAKAAAAARGSGHFEPPVRQPAITQPGPPLRDRPSGFVNGFYPYRGYGYPYGATPYDVAYDPYSGQAYLYPGGYYPYYGPRIGFGYPGAVFVNPGQLFGIGPIQQLMGVNPGFNPQQNFGPVGNFNQNVAFNGNNGNPGFAGGNQQGGNQQGGNNAAANVPPAPSPRKAAVVGSKATELAWKFITFGDARFGELKYSEAMERYRRAAKEAPTLGDAWFREGFALAAMGKYDQSAKAIRRGLDQKPDWADANFRLDDVYGDNKADKKACVDGMVKQAESEPTNGDLALVVGIHLYCDGKIDQAAPFFRRAAQIQGNYANIRPFLPK